MMDVWSKKRRKKWEEIGKQFNSRNGVNKRNGKQLKDCWKNLKAKTKKLLSNEKKGKRTTGGGPGTDPLDDMSTKIDVVLFCISPISTVSSIS